MSIFPLRHFDQLSMMCLVAAFGIAQAEVDDILPLRRALAFRSLTMLKT